MSPIRRGSWQSTMLSLVLCFSLQGIATSQPATSSAAKKPSSTSKTGNAKTKTSSNTHSPTNGHSTSKKTSPSSSQKSKGSRSSKHSKVRTTKKRGQQAIDGERARAIQEALIREHYMQGEPTGTWDGSTQSAMQRYQADHGWQSKTTPDSRALIKLGLGPSHDHLLNPESAMTSAPSPGDPKTAAKAGPSENSVPQQ